VRAGVRHRLQHVLDGRHVPWLWASLADDAVFELPKIFAAQGLVSLQAGQRGRGEDALAGAGGGACVTITVIPALRQAQDRLAFGQAGIQVVLRTSKVLDPGVCRDDNSASLERQQMASTSSARTEFTQRG
jgi:hypothetical protein